MTSLENPTEYDSSYVNPNIMRPQDTMMMRANLHHLSAAKPIGATVIQQDVIIREIGYDYPIAPQTFIKPSRHVGSEWDNRPA